MSRFALSHSLRLLLVVGAMGVLLTGFIALLADWFTDLRLVRPWLQFTAAIVGAGLLFAAGTLRSQSWLCRLILLVGGLLLMLTVLDSLDGRQDWLPTGVVLLSAWALEYAYSCVYLLDAARPRSPRRWLALGLGALASLGYFGVAGYYAFVHITIAPVQLKQHPLFGTGILIATLLKWLGEIGNAPQLTGMVQVCPACGLRNIPERTRCKRCRSPLAATQPVADDRLSI